jgi:TM2 domain-containing membrane protein YozV
VEGYAADKSPGIALVLSLLIVGLGQLYNGDVFKGIMMFIFCILLRTIFLGWIINIWSMIDAYSRAKEQRARHQLWQASARPA